MIGAFESPCEFVRCLRAFCNETEGDRTLCPAGEAVGSSAGLGDDLTVVTG
jgi:hypothetical protein